MGLTKGRGLSDSAHGPQYKGSCVRAKQAASRPAGTLQSSGRMRQGGGLRCDRKMTAQTSQEPAASPLCESMLPGAPVTLLDGRPGKHQPCVYLLLHSFLPRRTIPEACTARRWQLWGASVVTDIENADVFLRPLELERPLDI